MKKITFVFTIAVCLFSTVSLLAAPSLESSDKLKVGIFEENAFVSTSPQASAEKSISPFHTSESEVMMTKSEDIVTPEVAATDCLISITIEYYLYVEITDDYIYIEEGTKTTVLIVCWD